MKKIVFSLTLSAMLTIHCGGEEQISSEPVDESQSIVDTLQIVVTDTIGVEFGDSNYVFGCLMQVGHDKDGRILVLDIQKSYLSLFSEDGQYLRDIGRKGAGPGEFQFPMSFAALSDGGFAVADMMSRNISFFDSSYEYTNQMNEFFPSPPMRITGGLNNSFIGMNTSLNMGEDEVSASMDLSSWSISEEPDLVYFSLPLEIDMSEGGASISARGGFVFDTGQDGSVFLADASDSTFVIEGYSAIGEHLVSIEQPWERVEKSPEQLEDGGLAMSFSMGDEGSSANRTRVEDTYPWCNAIRSIGIDSQQQIWVRLGSEMIPTFQVYDYSGNLLFIAVFEEFGIEGRHLDIVIDEHGLLGFEIDPSDYPKIYLMKLQD